MRVSTAIMAHPRRRPFVAPLQHTLGSLGIPVAWDRQNDRWETGRRALLAYDTDADYHLVVQDDAVPCLDLVAGLEKALEYVAAEDCLAPVGLYVGNVRPFRSHLQTVTGATWVRMPQLNWGVAVAVPTAVIPDMVDYCDHIDNLDNYDLRMSQFFEHLGSPTWYTWPSLVDHKSSPSLVSGRGAGRHAFHFLGRTSSAAQVDWSGPVVDLDVRQEVQR